MTTYRLADNYGSDEEFTAPTEDEAVETAEAMLLGWYAFEDRNESHQLHAYLYEVAEFGEVTVSVIDVTLLPLLPDCQDGEVGLGHVWDGGDPTPLDGGLKFADSCDRCGLLRIVETAHTDQATGEPFEWTRYVAPARFDATGETR